MISQAAFERLREEIAGYGAQLVAVSKKVEPARIMRLYEWGQRAFGENRPQELRDKRPALPDDVEWHMIGRLQTNKVKYVVGRTALIQSVDRERLMAALQQRAEREDITQDVLIEVHIAQETSKAGMAPEEVAAFFEGGGDARYPNLRFRGLMGMATYTDDMRRVRAEFRALRKLFEQLERGRPGFSILSMGMSHDYGVALDEGATMVRLGSLLFGRRR